MAEQIQFELVSPEALLMSRPVDMVVVPGVEGDFGALPQHAPFISTLRPGVISVFEGNQVTDRVFVAGGFAEVTAERCTVLAERALPLRDLNREMVDAELPQHSRAPKVGEHTDEVLSNVLGYDTDRIEALRAAGALG